MYYEWSVDDLMRASVEACELRGLLCGIASCMFPIDS